jgi:zinc transport system ATP-binding protein
MSRGYTELLRLEEVRLDLGGRRILDGITFSVRPGEVLGLIGPNGGGKTSLLRVMLGILRPSSGRVRWPGRSSARPRLGYVPQRTAAEREFPLSCRAVIEQGAAGAVPLWGRRRREVRRRAERLLEEVGLEGSASTPFIWLSGGQQRRALLARAMMNDPELLLLDEPTAGVDVEGQQQFLGLLRRLAGSELAIVLVSHDIPLVRAEAQRIACLAGVLHWHGAASALEPEHIHAAYRCELERYGLQLESRSDRLERDAAPDRISCVEVR